MIEEIDLGENAKEVVRIAICQIQLTNQQMQAPNVTLSAEDFATVKRKVLRILTELAPHHPDAVVFPETSIPEGMIDDLVRYSTAHQCIVICGTHYTDKDGAIVSVCPIVIPRNGIIYTEKSTVSPYEKNIIDSDSVQPGASQYCFESTTIGRFGVLICSDFLSDEMLSEIMRYELDILFVVACQPDSERYFSRMNEQCLNSPEGIYIVYSNLKTDRYGAGKSALFAQIDRKYLASVSGRNLSDLQPEQKIWAANDPNDFLVCDLDLAHKRPLIGTSVHSEPNVSIVATRSGVRPRRLNYGGQGKYSLIGFDMDGTILRGMEFSWAVLWEACGDKGGAIWREHLRMYKSHKIDYAEWCQRAVEYYKRGHLRIDRIIDLAKRNAKLTKNFVEGISALKAMGFKMALISGGVDIFLRAIVPQSMTIFDDVFVNKLLFDADGFVSGVQPTAYDFEGKFAAMQTLCDKYDIDISECIYVGDRFNDEVVLAKVGHSIVYSDREDPVSLTAHKTIREDNFLLLVEYIATITGREIPQLAKQNKRVGQRKRPRQR